MWRALLAATVLAGCATVDRVEQSLGLDDGRPPPPDTGLEAVMAAAPRACPNGRTLEGANHEAFGPQHGVTGTDIAFTPLASDPRAPCACAGLLLSQAASSRGMPMIKCKAWR